MGLGGLGSSLAGEGSSRLVCRLVIAVDATGDNRGSIPYQDFRHIGLLGALVQLELFSTPLFGGSAEFGSDGIGVDKLLCKTGLAQEKCECRSTGEMPKGFLHIRLRWPPGNIFRLKYF
jgi:hypothetical protein